MHQAFPSAPGLSVGTRVTDTKLPLLALPTIPNAHKYPTNYSNIHPPVRTSLGQGRIEEGMGAKFRAMVGRRTCLGPRGHGSARTCSSTCRRETCTLSPAGLLQSSRRDPLRDKIREVGRGLSLADTQMDRYVRLYSRRWLCARRGADARLLLRILLELLIGQTQFSL